MRRISVMVVSAAACALAVGCSKKSEEPVMPSAPEEPVPAASSAAPAALTPAQQAAVAELPAPYNTGDPNAGQAKFAQCRSCHTIVKGAPNLTGPNLYDVFGTKAAEVPGFEFSDAMKGSGFTWNPPTLDKWITNPRAALPETKMTFLGIKDPKDRMDVIAYLATQRDER
jgi:cytochrome c